MAAPLYSTPTDHSALTSGQQRETTQVITVNSTGTYSLVATDANGCQNTASIDILEHPPVFADIVEIAPIELGDLDTISVLFPDPDYGYTWEVSDGSHPTLAPPSNMKLRPMGNSPPS